MADHRGRLRIAEYWRRRAGDARAKAGEIIYDEPRRRQLLAIAEAYEKLAQEAEQEAEQDEERRRRKRGRREGGGP
jgi:hypothetical protein